ncbi:MAG: hypothetical protein ACJAS9_004049 [Polaribacter sp.]|jgi:hypothetical protein
MNLKGGLIILNFMFLGTVSIFAQSDGIRTAQVTARLILSEVYNIEITEGLDIKFNVYNKEQFDNGIE